MKKILAAALAVLLMNSAYAERYEMRRSGQHEWRHESRQPPRHVVRHESNNRELGRWIVPALLGGIIGYELAKPRVVYTQTVYQPAVVVRERVYAAPVPQPVYKEIVEFDPGCNCYMHIQRQVGWR